MEQWGLMTNVISRHSTTLSLGSDVCGSTQITLELLATSSGSRQPNALKENQEAEGRKARLVMWARSCKSLAQSRKEERVKVGEKRGREQMGKIKESLVTD